MFDRLFRMDGRTAVVTGAGNGIGRSCALGLASFGAHVVCIDRNGTGAEETVALIRRSGGAADHRRVDVASEADVEAFWHDFASRHPRLDILVNNAGIATPPQRTHETSLHDWDRLMAVNLRGVFLVTRHALALMLKSGGGSIVNLSSIAGLKGYYPGVPSLGIAYATSKAGIVGFTRQIAAEYARDNIRVNAIAPGWHGGTALGAERRAQMTPDDVALYESHLRARIPLGRRGTPDDLVGLCVYLASDASAYVTGQVVAHDGGWDGMLM